MQAEKCKLYARAWHGNEKKHSSDYTVISSCALYRSFSGKVKKVLGIWWSEYCRKFLSEIWELCRAYNCQKQPTETHMVSTEAVVFSAQGQLKFQVFPFSPVQWIFVLIGAHRGHRDLATKIQAWLIWRKKKEQSIMASTFCADEPTYASKSSEASFFFFWPIWLLCS